MYVLYQIDVIMWVVQKKDLIMWSLYIVGRVISPWPLPYRK